MEGSQQEQRQCSAFSCYHHCSRENKFTTVTDSLHRKCQDTQQIHHNPLPVSATAFVGMLAEVQPPDFSFHHFLDLALWNPSEAGKHRQEFTASQTLNQGIKLARSEKDKQQYQTIGIYTTSIEVWLHYVSCCGGAKFWGQS